MRLRDCWYLYTWPSFTKRSVGYPATPKREHTRRCTVQSTLATLALLPLSRSDLLRRCHSGAYCHRHITPISQSRDSIEVLLSLSLLSPISGPYQTLAVTAPRRVKLDEKRVRAALHDLVKVGRRERHHLARTLGIELLALRNLPLLHCLPTTSSTVTTTSGRVSMHPIIPSLTSLVHVIVRTELSVREDLLGKRRLQAHPNTVHHPNMRPPSRAHPRGQRITQ